jgi:hypothetical protein
MIPLNQLVYLRNHRPSNLFVFQAMPCNEATGTYNANGIVDFKGGKKTIERFVSLCGLDHYVL